MDVFCRYCGGANAPQASFCFACGRSLAAPVLFKQRYAVLEHLGAGGFGNVYKVEDRQMHDRWLAVKKLDLNAIAPRDQQEAIRSFKQEAALLASLPPHPNLPRIYEDFAEQGNYFLVMDFIEGETLEEHLEKLKPALLPVSEVVGIGVQLAAVLDFLHTRRPAIIFRDLKPANIMITPRGQIYLIDFGIARHFKPGQAGDTVRWGTPHYAAPEQLAGEQTSASSDIYSLGVVLHEMLSGVRPQPRRLGPLQLSGPEHARLVHLVERMLKDDPQERPASAGEVEQELRQMLKEWRQPAGTPAGQAAPAAQPIPPTQLVVPSQAAAPTQRAAPPQAVVPTQYAAPPAPPRKARAPGELSYIYHAPQIVHALAWSPDGLYIAAAGEEPSHVSLWQAATGQTVQTYQNHTRSIWALAWSPDSRMLASAGNDRKVCVWEASSASDVQVYREHQNWVQALAWSPTSGLIASGDADNLVHIWNGQSGHQVLVYRGHRSPLQTLAFSPDGTLLASGDEEGWVHIWEVSGGKQLTTYRGHLKGISALAWSPDGAQVVSASWDRSVHIWEAPSGTTLATYAGHQRMVNALAWSPAAKRIASGGQDTTVQIWEAQSGQPHLTYRGHATGVKALAWSPDGATLASVGSDAAVHIWRAS